MEQKGEGRRKDKEEHITAPQKMIMACLLVVTAFITFGIGGGAVLASVLGAIFLVVAAYFLFAGLYSYFYEKDLRILVERRDVLKLKAVLSESQDKRNELNQKNASGSTLLHYALLDGRNISPKELGNFLDVLQQLITSKNINMKNQQGWTPLDIVIAVAIKDYGTIENNRIIDRLLNAEDIRGMLPESKFATIVDNGSRKVLGTLKLETLKNGLKVSEVVDFMLGWKIYEREFRKELPISITSETSEEALPISSRSSQTYRHSDNLSTFSRENSRKPSFSSEAGLPLLPPASSSSTPFVKVGGFIGGQA